MKKLREFPTPIQRFIKEQLVENYHNFLFDADGFTVYAENYEGWSGVKPDFISEEEAMHQ